MDAQKEHDKTLTDHIESPLKSRIEKLEGCCSDLAREANGLRYHIKQKDEEIERLKLRDEFLTKKEKEKAGTPSGVLNSDVF